jgi:hypothetical protein
VPVFAFLLWVFLPRPMLQNFWMQVTIFHQNAAVSKTNLSNSNICDIVLFAKKLLFAIMILYQLSIFIFIPTYLLSVKALALPSILI